MSVGQKHTLRNMSIAILVAVIGGLAVYGIQKFIDREPVYKYAESEHCGVQSYKRGTGEVCGVVYNSKREPACGVELYNLGQGKECGIDKDPNHWVALKTLGYRSGNKTNYCLDHGYGGHNGLKPNGHCYPYFKCRNRNFGVETYRLCARKEFGFSHYEQCRHESFGVDKYQSCRHESHGIEHYEY